MLVNFMIIGAQKCGTTTLSEILRNHPGIVGCNKKEPHFFSETKNWEGEIEAYHSLFNTERDALYFEASTSYTFFPHRNLQIWDDIYEYNPDMKFIYLVRNPIDRIISGYMHSYEIGYTDLSFEEALVEDSFFLNVTRYHTQIDPYIRKFGRENVLIIDFDEFVNSRDTILTQISDFLSISSEYFSGLGNVHANKSIGGKEKLHRKFNSPSLLLKVARKFFPSIWHKITDNSNRRFNSKPTLKNEYRELIINSLRLEVEGLQKLMDKDLSSWFYEAEYETLE